MVLKDWDLFLCLNGHHKERFLIHFFSFFPNLFRSVISLDQISSNYNILRVVEVI